MGRERLLDAALLLFSRQGIASTTVGQIAAEANVTSGMVHYWFDSRERLLDAIVDERLAPQMQEIWGDADFDQESALELVEGLTRRLIDIVNRSPWLPSLWLREIIQEGGQLRERVMQRIPPRESSAFRERVAEAQARGELNPGVAPDLLFISLLALVLLPRAANMLRNSPFGLSQAEPAQFDRHVQALLLQGLAPGEQADGAVPADLFHRKATASHEGSFSPDFGAEPPQDYELIRK